MRQEEGDLRTKLGDGDGAGTGESFVDCFVFQCNGPGRCSVNRSMTWSSLFHRVAVGTYMRGLGRDRVLAYCRSTRQSIWEKRDNAVVGRKAEVGPSSTINLLLFKSTGLCFVTLKFIFRVGTV